MESVPGWAGLVSGGVLASIAIITFWMRFSADIATAKLDANAAGLRATQANLKIDLLQTEVTAFRVYAEKEFINQTDLAQLSLRHEAQFDDLREDLKGITQRLDRLLDNRKPI